MGEATVKRRETQAGQLQILGFHLRFPAREALTAYHGFPLWLARLAIRKLPSVQATFIFVVS